MDNVSLESLLNDPNMLNRVQIMARRERARMIGEALKRFAGALKRGWARLAAPRESAGQRAAHCG